MAGKSGLSEKPDFCDLVTAANDSFGAVKSKSVLQPMGICPLTAPQRPAMLLAVVALVTVSPDQGDHASSAGRFFVQVRPLQLLPVVHVLWWIAVVKEVDWVGCAEEVAQSGVER
ncbi:MAG: hypothetical protein FJ279_13340 [Planctomycetes bacterium]|nr:hypothetical protein [Planctomycetota bacterium]MBM4081836.1 hypothetical protein [Planctomycetota bacterium]